MLRPQFTVEPAHVVATIERVKKYEAAITSFRDRYHAFPGDIADTSRLDRCNANCAPAKISSGDNVIGSRQFGSNLKSGLKISSLPPSSASDETVLFWQHLLAADLISGVTDSAIHSPTPLAWGITMPASPTGGGFVVGYADGKFPEHLSPLNEGMKGTILVLKLSADDSIALDTPGIQPLSPAQAAFIDRKLDDGKPSKGFVQAYGAPSCFKDGGINYDEANPKKDCGLIFRIQAP
ncbi:MAG: hypothetical protein K0R10_1355 [Alphaproteobacteria bacterium]|nr:hypothetical protein [Alphaproteobacteria bacterium]